MHRAGPANDDYRDLYELAPVAYVTLDPDGYMLEANHSAAALLGCDRARLLGQSLHQFMSEIEADRWSLHRRDATSDPGAAHTIELELGTGADPRRPVRIDTRVLPGRKPRHLLALVDMTERAELEQALRAREAEAREHLRRFEEIAAKIEEVFYVATVDGRLVYVSRAFETIFGRTSEQACARADGWLAWIHSEDVALVRDARAGLVAGRELDIEYRIVQPEGDVRILRERAFYAPDDRRITGIAHDVTRERRLERQIEERHGEKMEAVGRLSSGIAHDFNNLLMGMIGYGQLAMSHLDRSSPAYGYVQRSLRAAERGATLTRQLLAFARKRSTGVEMPIELDAAVAAATSLTERLVGAHIEQRVSTGAPGRHILADPGEIEQLLLNLAANARDAMPKGGVLTIATSVVRVPADREPRLGETCDCVCLAVGDTGPGMDEETQARVFEPFFTTKDLGKGTGLGLSTVFAIVERRGGKIHIVSELGHGTQFFVHFPIEPPPVNALEAPRDTRAGTGTLLVVEDDDLVRTTVRSYLAKLGYDVLTAASAEEAMFAVKAGHRLDAMITDVVMPEQLGTSFAAEVRQRCPELAIVFMSAHPREHLVETAELPEDAILLEKPFNERALATAIERALGRVRQQ